MSFPWARTAVRLATEHARPAAPAAMQCQHHCDTPIAVQCHHCRDPPVLQCNATITMTLLQYDAMPPLLRPPVLQCNATTAVILLCCNATITMSLLQCNAMRCHHRCVPLQQCNATIVVTPPVLQSSAIATVTFLCCRAVPLLL